MSKRPLLLIFSALSIGILLQNRLRKLSWAVFFFYLFLGLFFLLFLVMKKNLSLQRMTFCKRNPSFQRIPLFHRSLSFQHILTIVLSFLRNHRIFFLLPIFLFFGAFLSNQAASPYPMDEVLVDKTEAVSIGHVRSIHKTKSGYQVQLGGIRIKLANSPSVFTKGKLLVYLDDADLIHIGNVIRVTGEAIPLSTPRNDGQYDEKGYFRSRKICCKQYADQIELLSDSVSYVREGCRRLRERLSAIYDEVLPEKQAGVVSAILLGDKAGLDADTKELYQRNGIAHILAISGLHVSLLGLSLFSLMRKCGSPLLLATSTTVSSLLFYGFLTDFSVSTKRAIGMLIFAMLAKLLGRKYDSRSACALCAILLLLPNPLELFEVGFLLSFGASFGLSYFQEELGRMRLQKGKNKLSSFLLSLLSGLTTQIATIPMILYFFYEIPIYSVLLNLPVIGLLSWLVALSLLTGIGGMFSLTLGKFFAGGVYCILKIYEGLCYLMENLPAPIWLYGKPSSWRIALYFGILFCFFATARLIGKLFQNKEKGYQKRRFALVLLLFLPFSFVVPPWETKKEVVNLPVSSLTKESALLEREKQKNRLVTIDFLSVGQGDCAVIRDEKNRAFLIDCGSLDVKSVGKYRLVPYLKYHGIKKLEAVFVSHPDSDHMNGIMELIEATNAPNDWYRGQIQIGKLVLPAAFQKQSSGKAEDKGFEELISLAKKKQIEVLEFLPGDSMCSDYFSLRCLHPRANYPTGDSNDASLCLQLRAGEVSAFFVGDIGKSGEKAMLSYLEESALTETKNNRYTILKVAHHGSKNSSSRHFLEIIQPDLSVVSVGKNTFGHPNPVTLDALSSVDSYIARTDMLGQIQLSIRGGRIELRSYFSKNH